MADISKVTLPNDASYDIKDANAIHSVNITQTAVSSETTKEIAKIEVDESKTSIYADDADKILRAAFGEHTVTGNPVSADAFLGLEVPSECKVTMNPIQDLHGYSNPWAGGAGKNKLVYPYYNQSIEASGIKFTVNSDGTVLANGTATDTRGCYMINEVPNTFAGMKLNGAPIGTTINNGICVQYFDGGTFREADFCYNRNEITIKSSDTISIYVRIGSGVTVDNVLYKPMLRLSTESDASFAPYSNICPISGRTEASVTRTGANVWGGETLADDIVSKVPNVTKDTTEKVVAYTASNISSITNLFTKFKPNTRYTAIIRMKGGVPNMRFEYTDRTSTGISVGVTVSTEGKTVKCISGQWQTGSSSMYYDQSGIFEGVKTADDFEPYTAETHTHQYGQTVYGGEDDFVNGGATSEQGKLVLNGTENWSADTGRNGVYYLFNTMASSTYADSVCDRFKTIHSNAEMQSLGIAFGIQNKAIYIPRLFDGAISGVTDVASWKTYLSNNNMEITYPLATPTTIDTSAEEITLLKGNNVLSTDGDNLELKYSADIKAYIDKKLEELS